VTGLPFTSVVVPTHNRVPALRACLDSLAALDYPRERYEIVVVDDGGSAPLDGLLDPLPEHLRVELVAQQRAGPAAARNAGVKRASGELLAFTDDDCRPRPDWLRHLAARFQAAPEEAVGGRTINALRSNLYSAAAQLVIDVGYRQNNEGPEDRRWFTTNNLAVPAAGFRTLGGFDPSFRTAEDRDFCSRWVQSGRRMSYEPRAVVDHAHPLGLESFLRMHFAYGRGSFRYRRAQRRRGRGVPLEPSFYLALARTAHAEADRRRRLALAGLVLGWLVATTAGFAAEGAQTALKSRRSAAPAAELGSS
jgi:glycosyltransferase involved in cell wall biosynthesis